MENEVKTSSSTNEDLDGIKFQSENSGTSKDVKLDLNNSNLKTSDIQNMYVQLISTLNLHIN